MGNKYKVNKLGVVMMFLVFICLFLLTLNYTILSLETTEAGSKLYHYVCVFTCVYCQFCPHGHVYTYEVQNSWQSYVIFCMVSESELLAFMYLWTYALVYVRTRESYKLCRSYREFNYVNMIKILALNYLSGSSFELVTQKYEF